MGRLHDVSFENIIFFREEPYVSKGIISDTVKAMSGLYFCPNLF